MDVEKLTCPLSRTQRCVTVCTVGTWQPWCSKFVRGGLMGTLLFNVLGHIRQLAHVPIWQFSFYTTRNIIQQVLLLCPDITISYYGLQYLHYHSNWTFMAAVHFAVLYGMQYELEGPKNVSSENSVLLCYGAVLCGRWLLTFRINLQLPSANRNLYKHRREN